MDHITYALRMYKSQKRTLVPPKHKRRKKRCLHRRNI